jgi:hypothetical protein
MRYENPYSPFGMEKFFELGLGVALAQEMARATTAMMQQLNAGPNSIPAWGSPPAWPPPHPTIAYHLAIEGRAAGPFTTAEVAEKLRSGEVNRETLVWRPGVAAWAALGRMPELGGLFLHIPPPLPPTHPGAP